MLDLSGFFKLKKIKCAGLGEVLFDIYPDGAKLGGAPANFAFHCKQLGLDAIVISAVGHDELGERARRELAAKFLPALLPESPKLTGAVNVTLSSAGVPAYVFLEDTAYDNIPFTETTAELAQKMNIVCFGTLAQRGKVTHETVLKFLDSMNPACRLRVFDINLRRSYYSKKIIDDCLNRCEILKCNEDELPVLCEYAGLPAGAGARDYYAWLQSKGICCLIFTEGARQSTVFLNDEFSCQPTPRVNAIDTVGAGDSFTASLVSLMVKGWDLSRAHKLAVEIAAYVCTQHGAMPELSAELFGRLD